MTKINVLQHQLFFIEITKILNAEILDARKKAIQLECEEFFQDYPLHFTDLAVLNELLIAFAKRFVENDFANKELGKFALHLRQHQQRRNIVKKKIIFSINQAA